MKAAKLVASDPGVSALGWGPQHLPGEAIPMLALVSRAKTVSSCAPLESPNQHQRRLRFWVIQVGP